MNCYYPTCKKPLDKDDCVEITRVRGNEGVVMGRYHKSCYDVLVQYLLDEQQQWFDAVTAVKEKQDAHS